MIVRCWQKGSSSLGPSLPPFLPPAIQLFLFFSSSNSFFYFYGQNKTILFYTGTAAVADAAAGAAVAAAASDMPRFVAAMLASAAHIATKQYVEINDKTHKNRRNIAAKFVGEQKQSREQEV